MEEEKLNKMLENIKKLYISGDLNDAWRESCSLSDLLEEEIADCAY